MTARSMTRLRFAGLGALMLAAALLLALALAALRIPSAHADGIQSAAAEPAADTWRTGAPLAAILVGVAAFAIVAARRDPRRAWIWAAAAGAALLAIDTLRSGRTPNLEMLLGPGAVLAAGALPGASASSPRPPERGSAGLALLAWVGASLAMVGLAMGAWSCSSAQRRATGAAIVDCTAAVLAEHAAAWRPLVQEAIRTGDWSAVRAAAMAGAIEEVGCAAAAVVIEIERPPGATLGPAPDPAAARAAWEQLRAERLGGRTFETRAGRL